MTLFFQLLFATADISDGSVPITSMASFTVTGVYKTAGGGGGTVIGGLTGDVDNGVFTGTVIFEAPGCTAEREYSGTITAAAVTLSGARTLRDCKDNPLSWSSLSLVRGDGLPITTSIPTTTPGACTYGITPTSGTVGGAGGTGDVDVTSQPGCGWTAQSFVPWVTVQPTAAPTGNGKARYTVQANTGAQRTATLVIAGQAFTLTQLAAGVGLSTTTSSTSSSSTSTSGPSTVSTTTPGPGPSTTSTSSSTSTSTSVSTSSSTTSSVAPPSFAATVYPNMGACASCHPTSTSGAAFTWVTTGGRSDPPGATALLVIKPSQTGVTHTGGTLWPSGSPSNLAAIAWIDGGRLP